MMKLSPAGLALIRRFEGFSPVPYFCSAGRKTVGIGHVILPHEQFDRITEAEAMAILARDVEWVEDAINSFVTVPLTENQFSSLASLVLNIGASAFRRSTLLAMLNKGNVRAAADRFLAWRFAGGKPILLGRRLEEKRLFLTDLPPR